MADFTIGAAKGFNPFLSDFETSTPEPIYSSEAQQSNPFLQTMFNEPPMQEITQSSGRSENPFLNYTASFYDYPAEPISENHTIQAASNPFADFAIGETTSNVSSALQDPISASPSKNNGPFAMDWSTNDDMISDNKEMIDLMTDSFMDSMPQEISSDVVNRPPPPSVPQSTKDLLDTVTGALEATSDSLLDRLRVTQPSPTPLAPSPSPSPRSPSPDLMLGEESFPPTSNPMQTSPNPMQPSPNHSDSIIDMFESTQPGSTGQKSSVEILGLYNKVNATPTPQRTIPQSTMSIISSEPENLPLAETETLLIETKESDVVDTIHILAPVSVSSVSVSSVSVVNSEAIIQTTALIAEAKVPDVKPILAESNNLPLVETNVDIAKPVKAPPPERPKAPRIPPQRPQVPDLKYATPTRPPPPVPKMTTPEPPSPIIAKKTTPDRPQAPSAPPVILNQPPLVENEAPFMQLENKNGPDQNSNTQIAASHTTVSDHGLKDILVGSMENHGQVSSTNDTFDAFEAKFNSFLDGDQVRESTPSPYDPFGVPAVEIASSDSAWGGDGAGFEDSSMGFGTDAGFDPFLSLTEPPPAPQSTPAKSQKSESNDEFDKESSELAIFIRPKNINDTQLGTGLTPALAPPPKSPAISTGSAFSEETSAFVPFLSSAHDTTYAEAAQKTQLNRTDSQETPQTPLFEEDTSQPLEDFPRTKFSSEGWEMQMRHPNKKKITGQRFWKKVFVRIAHQNDVPVVQIFNNKGDKDPFQEIPLQPCYSVSDIGAQQFDNYGKIFTVKLQYIFYKERPGVRPGQITKAERITNKLSQFAAYAIQGDYQGVKEFGSDLKKLGLPVEHAPQISQLVKLGTQSFEELKQFSMVIEESLFKMAVHRDRVIQYKSEEVQVTLVDEYYVEQDIYGVVTKQIARVRLFFLSFLSGAAEVEMGINDLRRQGKEVVGRHDIIPIATEEWIRIEEIEFSNCVQLDEFENTKTIKFKPPDACYVELIRFRVRPPKHRELPLQVKTVFTTTGNRVEIRCDVLVPGFTSRKLGQIPCEDVMIRFPIPECWIYMFRVEKHFRYGSVKSAHRRSGKVKGIERFLGAVETVEQSLMEVTSGQAKYEHQHRSIVWRIARLPKDGQGAYTTHSFFCHITLQAHEEIPESLSKHCYVEFTMPHTTISHTVCRSISVPTSDEPPEKYVRYLSRHECVVEIEHTQGITPATYNLAAAVPIQEEPPPPPKEQEPSKPETKDSDSDFSD